MTSQPSCTPDGALDAPDVECPRLTQALTWFSAPGASQPAIDDQDTDLESALQRAADILKSASRPLFGGLVTDVAGAPRALPAGPPACGAILDHLHGDAMAASTAALQDRGAFFTTLSEVRSRADLLIISIASRRCDIRVFTNACWVERITHAS